MNIKVFVQNIRMLRLFKYYPLPSSLSKSSSMLPETVWKAQHGYLQWTDEVEQVRETDGMGA